MAWVLIGIPLVRFAEINCGIIWSNTRAWWQSREKDGAILL